MNELTSLPAVVMAEMVRARKISPVELVAAHLQRISAVNPALNAFVELDSERAEREARTAEVAVMRGELVGPLCGVPVSIKSSIEVSGLRCEAGTKLRGGVTAERDAPLVQRLRRGGAVVLGTTNTPELLMAWETDNLLYGRTNNPWDLARTPGGSSGGEAAAIASGCSAGGVGSDGGGSIRVPAHFSGICGLKPTPGRIPITGHYPGCVGPFALLGVVGPMARTVADLQALFAVMAGQDDGDTCAAPVPLRMPSSEEVRGVRIGYFVDDGHTPVTPETAAAVHTAASALERTGFHVAPFRPDGLELARQLWWKFFGIAGGMLLRPMIAGQEAQLSPILKEFSAWVAGEPPLTADTLLDTWVQRDQLRTKVLAQMRECPILLCPVAAMPAFRHGERVWHINGSCVRYPEAFCYSEWFNLLGNPAAVVPVGRSPENLPIGVQIVGRPWEEELVLAIAAEVERECGGWSLPPVLAEFTAAGRGR
jgi:Asp-tRNA(Asn)/Glu-tRNA(Gln) amidotransferase A subunit family amidase